jgi:hypothetical protein
MSGTSHSQGNGCVSKKGVIRLQQRGYQQADQGQTDNLENTGLADLLGSKPSGESGGLVGAHGKLPA